MIFYKIIKKNMTHYPAENNIRLVKVIIEG
jgi:hypothetical protein